MPHATCFLPLSHPVELYNVQPPKAAFGVWNRVEYRALEGFILAIAPFNFTAIGGNLPTVPAIVGEFRVEAAGMEQEMGVLFALSLFRIIFFFVNSPSFSTPLLY